MKKTTLKIAGNPYTLTALDARRTQEFLDYAKSKIPDPVTQLVEASEKLPEALRHSFLEKRLDAAFEASKLRGTLTDPALADFQKTTEGIVKLFGLLLRPGHPNLTEEDVAALVMDVDVNQEELDQAAEQLQRHSQHSPMTEEHAEKAFFRKSRKATARKGQ
jgi:hypothetical protein